MLKNKKANRLISNIVLAGLLTSTLPASLPINAQATNTLTKTEVVQKIKQIKGVVNGFKALKITGISLLVTGAVGILAAALATVGLLFFIPWSKLRKTIKATKKQLAKIKIKVDDFKVTQYAQDMILGREVELKDLGNIADGLTSQNIVEKANTTWNKLVNKIDEIDWQELVKKINQETLNKLPTTGIPKPITAMVEKTSQALPAKIKKKIKKIPLLVKVRFERMKFGEKKVFLEKEIKRTINDLSKEIASMQPLKKRAKTLALLGSMSGATALHLGLGGTILATIGAIFGLRATSAVKRAHANTRELEALAKTKLITLTAQQKKVINKFKKLEKNPKTHGVIQSFLLKNKLADLVNTAVKNNHKIVNAVGKKRARKLFASYIETKRKENLFQTTINEYAAMNIFNSKAYKKIKRQLNKTQATINNLEKNHPLLKAALEEPVQKYAKAANKSESKIREHLIEAVERKGFRPQPIAPVVRL